jgi:hypothetical protein
MLIVGMNRALKVFFYHRPRLKTRNKNLVNESELSSRIKCISDNHITVQGTHI